MCKVSLPENTYMYSSDTNTICHDIESCTIWITSPCHVLRATGINKFLLFSTLQGVWAPSATYCARTSAIATVTPALWNTIFDHRPIFEKASAITWYYIGLIIVGVVTILRWPIAHARTSVFMARLAGIIQQLVMSRSNSSAPPALRINR